MFKSKVAMTTLKFTVLGKGEIHTKNPNDLDLYEVAKEAIKGFYGTDLPYGEYKARLMWSFDSGLYVFSLEKK